MLKRLKKELSFIPKLRFAEIKIRVTDCLITGNHYICMFAIYVIMYWKFRCSLRIHYIRNGGHVLKASLNACYSVLLSQWQKFTSLIELYIPEFAASQSVP